MSILESIILAIVEGLTEFLPVSSTGHMILTEGVLQMQSTEYVKAFTVMIQFGAILAVPCLYFWRFIPFYKGNLEGATLVVDQQSGKKNYDGLQGWMLYLLMFVGCLPAAVLGLLFNDVIDELLGNLWVVIAMLFLGGIVMLFMEQFFTNEQAKRVKAKNAFVIGFYQCIAMIPGVSRSMATIFGGMQQGLTRKQAAEFSFFLALPTMFGATLLKAYKLFKEFSWDIFRENWDTLLVGNVVAFIVALLAIKGFIGYVSRYGFKVFGYYRIALALVFAVLLLCNVPIQLT